MTTTIAVSEEIRDRLKEFGCKGETYDDVIRRIIKSAKERQLQELMRNTKETISIKKTARKVRKNH